MSSHTRFVAAALAGGPGIGIHLRCMWLGLSLFLAGKVIIKDAVSLFFSPMDSTRYFEFHEIFLRKPASNVSRTD